MDARAVVGFALSLALGAMFAQVQRRIFFSTSGTCNIPLQSANLVHYLVERAHANGETGFRPAPVPQSPPYQVDGCEHGDIAPFPKFTLQTAKGLKAYMRTPQTCAQRAGDGHWNKQGQWIFDHAEECGHHWLSEAEICTLLQDFAVFFAGDATSRRQALHLQALLGVTRG